jgi:hypothetical protein
VKNWLINPELVFGFEIKDNKNKDEKKNKKTIKKKGCPGY